MTTILLGLLLVFIKDAISIEDFIIIPQKIFSYIKLL